MSEIPDVLVRRHPDLGWQWNVGHTCGYVCGAGGCDGAGWRLTKRAAIRSGRRYQRYLRRYQERTSKDWEKS